MSTNEGTSGGGTSAEGTPMDTQTQERGLRQEDEPDNEEVLLPRLFLSLLPGIPDNVTVHDLGPMLPWSTIYFTLPLLSSSWQRAIASRQLYEARVRARSTETLLVISVLDGDGLGPRLGLYSIKDERCFHLPPLPDNTFGPPPRVPNEMNLPSAFFLNSNVVTLAGKIYVLGSKWFKRPDGVFVLDSAVGERTWRQCASMLEIRDHYMTIKGKIYVLGSENDNGSCEVYDPEMDVWSPIEAMPLRYSIDFVATVKEEMFCYSKQYFKEVNGVVREIPDADDLLFVDVYNAAKDEWREVKEIQSDWGTPFMAGGERHSISDLGIEVHDLETDSWTPLHSNTFAAVGPVQVDSLMCFGAQCVDDELLLVASVDNESMCLFGSEGFGGENKEIVWQMLDCSLPLERFQTMCPIEL
ncbi:unnamed protein product [Calypogeia fissa]